MIYSLDRCTGPTRSCWHCTPDRVWSDSRMADRVLPVKSDQIDRARIDPVLAEDLPESA